MDAPDIINRHLGLITYKKQSYLRKNYFFVQQMGFIRVGLIRVWATVYFLFSIISLLYEMLKCYPILSMIEIVIFCIKLKDP